MSDEVRFGISMRSSWPLEKVYRDLSLIERYGFYSAWRSEHIVVPSKYTVYDTYCLLTSIAAKTEKLRLGVLVADPFRRHPATMAQTIATMDLISDGRTILGIGAGEPMNLVPYGIPYEKPVSRMAEYIEVLKVLWAAASPSLENPVSYDGRFFQLSNAYLQVKPVQQPNPPILVAANSPRARSVAGRLGDGWVTFMTTPEFFKHDLKEVHESYRRSERSLERFEAVCYVRLAVSEDHDAAESVIFKEARNDYAIWPNLMRRLGCRIPEDLHWGRYIVSGDADELYSEIAPKVPFEAVERLAIFGTPDECIDRIEKFVEAGANHFILSPSFPGKDSEETYRLLSEKVIPHFTEG